MQTSAKTFGTTRKRIGLSAIVRMASISSEITIVPISAAIAEPDRPETMIAVMSGPISRVIEMPTRLATKICAPNCRSCCAPFNAKTMPSRIDMNATIGTASLPTSAICCTVRSHLMPRRPNGRASSAAVSVRRVPTSPSASAASSACSPITSIGWRRGRGAPSPRIAGSTSVSVRRAPSLRFASRTSIPAARASAITRRRRAAPSGSRAPSAAQSRTTVVPRCWCNTVRRICARLSFSIRAGSGHRIGSVFTFRPLLPERQMRASSQTGRYHGDLIALDQHTKRQNVDRMVISGHSWWRRVHTVTRVAWLGVLLALGGTVYGCGDGGGNCASGPTAIATPTVTTTPAADMS